MGDQEAIRQLYDLQGTEGEVQDAVALGNDDSSMANFWISRLTNVLGLGFQAKLWRECKVVPPLFSLLHPLVLCLGM